MTNCYFPLALTEEKAGNEPAALLLYLSSFCDSFNSGDTRPYGTVAKIRMLQSRLSIPDQQLYDMIHSYGHLSDADCKKLLSNFIDGNIAGINATLAVYGCWGTEDNMKLLSGNEKFTLHGKDTGMTVLDIGPGLVLTFTTIPCVG